MNIDICISYGYHIWIYDKIIPHICNFFYSGRIFESLYFTPSNYEKHLKITTKCPQKCKTCRFTRSIWKNLHQTAFVYTGTACGACDKCEVCMVLAYVVVLVRVITDTCPPIVGCIYPIQVYILRNVHSPTLRPKGTKTPSN